MLLCMVATRAAVALTEARRGARPCVDPETQREMDLFRHI